MNNKKPLPPPRAPQPFNRQQAQPGRPGAIQLKNQRPGVVQRMGWGILDSRSNGGAFSHEIVHTNLANARKFYTRTESETNIDPSEHNVTRVDLGHGEALHIHAHGNEQGLGGFGPPSLARLAKAKFGANGLKGRTIVLHGCNVGSGAFLKDFLRALADTDLAKWDGTRVFGPENFLIVNDAGISLVARPGVTVDQLKSRADQRNRTQRKGLSWKGAEIKGGQVKDIPAPEVKSVVVKAMKEWG